MFYNVLKLKDLYYVSRTDQLQYNSSGQGEFDIDRLSEAEQFRSIDSGLEKKKKTLIFQDIFENEWDQTKTQRVSDLLVFLVNQGFEVYLPNIECSILYEKLEKNVKPQLSVTDPKLRTLKKIRESTPELQDTPIEALQRIDSTLIHYNDTSSSSYYFIHEISYFSNRIQSGKLTLEEIKEFFSQPQDERFYFYVDALNENTVKLIKEGQKVFQNIGVIFPWDNTPVSIDFNMETNDLEGVQHLIRYHSEQSNQYHIIAPHKNTEEKKSIFRESIQAGSQYQYKVVSVSANSASLHHIEDYWAPGISIQLNLKNKDDLNNLLDKLEHRPEMAAVLIDLTLQFHVNMERFVEVLNKNCLHKLNLNRIKSNFIIPKLGLGTRITELHISYCMVNTESIRNLIESSSQLEILQYLPDYSSEVEPIGRINVQLKNLRVLCLSQTSSQRNSKVLSCETVMSLIKNASKLEKLELKMIDLRGLAQSLREAHARGLKFESLVTLNLDECLYEPEDIIAILEISPNLELLGEMPLLDEFRKLNPSYQYPRVNQLCLETVKNHCPLDNFIGHFPSLTTLDLNGLGTEGFEIDKMEKHLDGIHDLNIYLPSLKSEFSEWHNLKLIFPQLTELTLRLTRFNPEHEYQPHVYNVIKELKHLSYPVDAPQDTGAPIPIYPKMKSRKFTFGFIEESLVAKILKNSPRLESLIINCHLTNTGHDFEQDETASPFIYLKHLTIGHGQTPTLSFILWILRHSPNLERFTINGKNDELIEKIKALYPKIDFKHSMDQNNSSYTDTELASADSETKEDGLDIDASIEKQESTSQTDTYIFEDQQGNLIGTRHNRNTVYHEIVLKPGVFSTQEKISPFLIKKANTAVRLPPIQVPHENLDSIFQHYHDHRGVRKILKGTEVHHLSPEKCFSLPSRTYEDELLGLCIEGLTPDAYEIIPNKNTDQYEIHLKPGTPAKNYKIEYLILTPLSPKVSVTENADIQALILSYKTRQEVVLKMPSDKTEFTALEYMKAYQEQKAGACRHKALACMHELKSKYPEIGIRIINSKIHSFIEISLNPNGENPKWIICDVGGVSADLKMIKRKTQALENKEIASRPAIENPVFHQKGINYPASLTEFMNQIKISQGSILAIDFPSDDALKSFQNAFRHSTRHCFMASTVKDLRCQSTRTQIDAQGVAEETKGPCGPLYRFLNEDHQGPAYLLLDFTQFLDEDKVRFNSILDEKRKADEVPVPDHVKIIVLSNSRHEGVHHEADLTSRVDTFFIPPYKDAEYSSLNNKPSKQSPDSKIMSVNLFNSPSWRSLLLGNLIPVTGSAHLCFKEGPLLQALTQGINTLALCDAPWDDPEFNALIDQVLHDHRIEVYGRKYKFPQDFKIIKGHSQDFSHMTSETLIKRSEYSRHYPGTKALTPSSFSKFFQANDYDFQKSIMTLKPGWLEQAKAQGLSVLNVYLAAPLPDDHWNQLIFEAYRLGLKIHVDYPLSADSTNLKFIKSFPKEAFVLDCTDYSPSDLFIKCKGKLVQKDFSFETQEGVVLKALRAGKQVVLNGRFSDELKQYLAEFSLNPQCQHWLTQLTLCIENPIPQLKLIQQVVTQPSKITPLFVAVEHQLPLLEDRKQAITRALQANKVCLLTGKTGVGKTTLMKKAFPNHHTDKLRWAQATSQNGQDIILFYDEYNIKEEKTNELTEFSGLMATPPFCIIEGQVYTLTEHHKVVCAGNPLSYGGDRHEPLFFKLYPHSTVEIKELSANDLKTETLAPYLKDLPDWQNIADIFIELYLRILALSTDKPLISPRELVQMALLFLSKRMNLQSVNQTHFVASDQLAAYCAQIIAQQTLSPELYSQLNLKPLNINSGSLPHTADFIITPSRYNLAERLNEIIDLRTYKIENKISGGLGGAILEGEPGTGKSEFVVQLLLAKGFKEGHLHSQTPNTRDIFYRVPVQASYKDKCEILTRAFKEGAVVIIDEINSSSTMERLLNEILSSEQKGLLIGTQNPLSYKGRRVMSVAMQRRLLHIKVPEYPQEEMEYILIKKYKIPPRLAEELVFDFQNASKNSVTPLSFRVLVKHHNEALHYIIKTVNARTQFMSPEDAKNFIKEINEYLTANLSLTANEPTSRVIVHSKGNHIGSDEKDEVVFNSAGIKPD